MLAKDDNINNGIRPLRIERFGRELVGAKEFRFLDTAMRNSSHFFPLAPTILIGHTRQAKPPGRILSRIRRITYRSICFSFLNAGSSCIDAPRASPKGTLVTQESKVLSGVFRRLMR